jgi:bifunctional non-homologous end joining protein LigD
MAGMGKLKEYRRKRRFERTPEPRGSRKGKATGNRFVVQKHAARRLHYDFRLEIGRVLKSWAVPKGPSLNPRDKRLAVQTEDHPLDYGDFEGVIPERQYGAGTVMVWDTGTFETVGELSANKQLARGELKFLLQGRKLRGGFVLVKLRRGEKGNEWLLIKHRDAAVDPQWDIGDHDGSVFSGRTLGEIAEGLPPVQGPHYPRPVELEGARPATLPTRLSPLLATLVDKPFSDPDWVFEVKWDGVRALAWIDGGRVELRSRTGQVITAQYPELAVLPERLLAKQAILDGEIVVLDGQGRGDFERLQSRMHVRRPAAGLQEKAPVTYYLFDALYCDGYDLRAVPLVERKRFLRRLLDPRDRLRYSDHQEEQGKELFALAQAQGLEGIVGKHAGSPYVSRRSPYWVKFKVRNELDGVVGGWTEPRGGREHFGALLLGLYEGKRLRFIGGVGSGFTRQRQKSIFEQLATLKTKRCPFESVPQTKEKAHWVEPRLVARVEYGSWTQERRLRQPVFLGLEADRNPQECQFDAETPLSRPPAVVAVPAIVGRLLTRKTDIERELFHGRAENVTLELDGKRVRLSNLNKVYFPGPGYTKRQLLAYYYRMADRVLPFLKDRPLVLRRYPEGIEGESFFQKDAGESVPEWMETVAVHSEERREEIHYYVANSRAALLYLTNLGCIDHNPWSSRRDNLDTPDYVFFDLDPAEGSKFATVVAVARAVDARLLALGLTVYLKTSGATGLHLYLPIERRYSYEQVRAFGEIVARLVASEESELVTQERAVGKRARGKIYIDVHQNAFGRPLAAPYTVRAFPQASVSAPLEPRELRASLRPEKFNLKTMFARLEKRGDLWTDFWKRRQRLEKATQRLSQEVGRRRR